MFLSFHIPLLLLACGIVFFTITVQPNEHRLARLVLSSTVLLAVVVYLDWHSGLVWHARPEQVHGVGWVWYFYIFEFVAFAEFALTSRAWWWAAALPRTFNPSALRRPRIR